MQYLGPSNLLMANKPLLLAMQDSGVDVFAVQPGLTNTSLYSGMQKTFVFYWFFLAMTFLVGQSPERGSLSLLYCATAPELQGTVMPQCSHEYSHGPM